MIRIEHFWKAYKRDKKKAHAQCPPTQYTTWPIHLPQFDPNQSYILVSFQNFTLDRLFWLSNSFSIFLSLPDILNSLGSSAQDGRRGDPGNFPNHLLILKIDWIAKQFT